MVGNRFKPFTEKEREVLYEALFNYDPIENDEIADGDVDEHLGLKEELLNEITPHE